MLRNDVVILGWSALCNGWLGLHMSACGHDILTGLGGSQCTKPLLRCIALWHVVTRLSLLVTVLVKEWHCGLTVLAQPSLLVLATNTRSQLCAPLIACCGQLPRYARLRRIAPLSFRIRSSTATHVAIRWLKDRARQLELWVQLPSNYPY